MFVYVCVCVCVCECERVWEREGERAGVLRSKFVICYNEMKYLQLMDKNRTV